MRIDKKLNLVIPIYGDEVPKIGTDGKPVIENGKPAMDAPVVAYVHSTPLSAEVVDRYYMILARTQAKIFGGGLGIVGGPAIAMRLLRETAMDADEWFDKKEDGKIGVQKGLIEEIFRLTMVGVPTDNGWQPMPFKVACDQGHITTDEKTEVENAIVFFIVGSAMLPRGARNAMLEGAAGLWSAHLSFLNSTAFFNSLKTSTATVSSGEKIPVAAPIDTPPANAIAGGQPRLVPV